MTTIVATDGLVLLNEYESVKVTGLQPSPADIDAAESEALTKRITLRWLRGDTLEITANSHVGVVSLNCVTIHVRPKLAGRDLAVLQMLDYASGLSALNSSLLPGRLARTSPSGARRPWSTSSRWPPT
ncbi:MAG: McrBC 5-methylcytosine restriction system component-like protein, partial [Gemmatimonadales bacterium]|nr:McrBC 5-methylcytosine restriction system component-like protein [Gemmatimonadales bacterium]